MLVNCAVYEDGRKVADIPVDAIGAWLQRAGCFVWVALKEPDAGELEQMRRQFDLHPLAVEDALKGHQRPKIEEYGATLFAALHLVEPRGAELAVGEVNVFVGPNFVLSVRRGAEAGFQAVRERAEREPELLRHGAGFVLYAIMDNVVDRYFPLVDALEVELEAIERRLFADGAGPRRSIEDLYTLKHRLTVVRHAVEPLIEAVHHLFGGRVPHVAAGTQEYFRDVYDHLLRVSQQLDALREMVVTAMSVTLTMISLDTGETTKRLAAYAALVAVPTLIAGIYGMNFEHMPELDARWGYPAALAAMAGLDAWLFHRFRKAGWL